MAPRFLLSFTRAVTSTQPVTNTVSRAPTANSTNPGRITLPMSVKYTE